MSRVPARQERPHHRSVLRRPEGAPRQTHCIDDVADQHDALGLEAVQKLVQLAHARVSEAQVNVREEQGAGPRSAGACGVAVCHGVDLILGPSRAFPGSSGNVSVL